MSQTIVKVKLLNNGMKGIEFHAEDPIVKENVIIKGFIKKVYPIPLPSDIIQLIQRMKRYLLHMSGYWRKEFDQYIVKGELIDIADPDPTYYDLMKLFNNTRIEEISRFKGKYSILGFYMNDWKFHVKILVNSITIDTGYDDYDKLDRGMKHIFKSITEFIEDERLRKMEPKQYMLDLWEGKSEMLQRLDGLDDDQIAELQAKVMEEKGYIVLKQEDDDETNLETDEPKHVSESEEKVEVKDENPDMNDVDEKTDI